jgi:hypothetical protein
MAAPYNPIINPNGPYLEPWVPPSPPTETLDYAKLHTIDLALVDSPNKSVRDELIATCKEAIRDDGFLYLVNYGVSLDQLHRQFSIAQHLHRHISDEDKERLHWDPQSGVYAGYKPPFGWRVSRPLTHSCGSQC